MRGKGPRTARHDHMTSVRIDPQLTSQLGSGSLAPRGETAPQSGTFRGEAVQVRNAASDLANAAEELTLFASEKVEKELSKREVKGGGRTLAMTVQQITEYLEKARRGADPQQMQQAARALLRNPQADIGQMLRNQRGLGSPTDQFLLLQMAREMAQAEGAPTELIQPIDDALGDLETWNGKTIRADLATIDQAGAYGRSAQEVRSFQGAVHVVLGKPTLAQALQETLALAGKGGARLEAAVDNLMGAMGALLAATRSAAEKVLLESLMTDLYHLKALKTLMAESRKLLQSLKRQGQAAMALRQRQRKEGDEDDEEEGGRHGDR